MTRKKYICFSLHLKDWLDFFSLTNSSSISCLKSDPYPSSKLGHVWFRRQCVSSNREPVSVVQGKYSMKRPSVYSGAIRLFSFWSDRCRAPLTRAKIHLFGGSDVWKRLYNFFLPWKFSFQRKISNTIIMLVIIKVCLKMLSFYHDARCECQSLGETFHVIH